VGHYSADPRPRQGVEGVEMTNEQLVEIVTKALPYSQHISDWDFSFDNNNSIRFTWRSDRFRVSSEGLSVEECRDGMLASSNLSILLETLLKKTAAAMEWSEK